MMETAAFQNSINAISERFFSFEEFPDVSRSRFPIGICEAALKVKERDLASYGVSLTGKELEAMLLDFPALKTAEEWERIGSILMIRFSNRIIKLIYNLFQVYCDSDAILFLAKKTVREARRRQEFPVTGRFLWDFGESEDLFAEAAAAFLEKSGDLDQFFQYYHIREDAPLAIMFRRRCLENAEPLLILKNARHLVCLIGQESEEDLFRTVTNYIDRFDVLNSPDEVNQAVLQRVGEPSNSKWDGFSGEIRRKFTQWYFCHLLRLHSYLYPQKYEILRRYYESVRQCRLLEETPALVIEFEKIVVVDLSGCKYSCFYHKEDFDREIMQWKEFDIQPSFLKDDRAQISARDYIIEDKEEPCILLRYEGIDLLYIKELLDIKIGLVPDLRQMKLKRQQEL